MMMKDTYSLEKIQISGRDRFPRLTDDYAVNVSSLPKSGSSSGVASAERGTPPMRIVPGISILGIDFLIEKDIDFVHIHHEKWSLAGTGQTMQEAIKDMLDCIRFAMEEYADAPNESLTQSAIEFKYFLIENIRY